MTCQEFLARFSEYYDARTEIPREEAFERHMVSCLSCRHYVEVVTEGTDLLRSLPPLDVPPDFHPRLQHRLYHVDDGAQLSRGSSTSATTAVTALAMAVLLGLAAWSPALLDEEPETVRLAPIVVRPPAERATFFSRSTAATLFAAGASTRRSVPEDFGPLWERPNTILYRYSPLSERHREPGLVQTGFD